MQSIRKDRVHDLVVQALGRDLDELDYPRAIIEMLMEVYEDFADTTEAEIVAAVAECNASLGR